MDAAVSVSEEQLIVVCERLRLLAIGYYIRGGIIAAFSSFFVIYAIFMFGMTLIPDSAWTNHGKSQASPASSAYFSNAMPSPTPSPQAPPKAFRRIIAAVFGFLVLLGWTLGGLTAYAGWCIQKRRHKVLIYIAAAFNYIFIPYGTLLGVATIIVMSSAAGHLEFESARTAIYS
jgi:hypothetical protein